MDRGQMLKRMGLSEPQFEHLMKEFRKFYHSLDAAEKAVIRRSLPTLEAAAKTFGPEVKARDVQELFSTDDTGGTFNSEMGELQPYPNGDGDDDDDQ